MTILRVPILAGNIADWVRKAATAINQIIDALNQPVTSVSTTLPVYADNAAAVAAGAAKGSLYLTAATDGELRVVS